MLRSTHDEDEVQPLELKEQLRDIIEEARMVMPGMQALFGFQLVAIYSSDFRKVLSHAEQVAHLVALGLTAVAIGFVLTPAAIHCQAEPTTVSTGLVRFARRFLAWSLVPLALGTVIDLYLVTDAVLNVPFIAAIVAAGATTLFTYLWFILPWTRRQDAPKASLRGQAGKQSTA